MIFRDGDKKDENKEPYSFTSKDDIVSNYTRANKNLRKEEECLYLTIDDQR